MGELILNEPLSLETLAKHVIEAKLAPQSFKTAASVMVAFQVGAEVGLSPMHSLSSVVVINNIPSWRGDAAIAIVRFAHALQPGTDIETEYTGEPGGDEWAAHVTAYRVNVDKPFRRSFSVLDAKRARLWGANDPSPWKRHPKRMLYYRALGFMLRDGFSDVLKGLTISEEVTDFPTIEKDITPPRRDPPVTADPLLSEIVEVHVDPAAEVPQQESAGVTDAVEEEAFLAETKAFPPADEPPHPSLFTEEEPPQFCGKVVKRDGKLWGTCSRRPDHAGACREMPF